MKVAGSGISVGATLGTLAIATAGGALAHLLSVPLAWLIGSQVALGAASLMGVSIFGAPLQWPRATRTVFLPVLGVMIGSAFTGEVFAEAPRWWPSLIAVSIFLLVVHAANFLLLRRVGKYDLPTAFFAAFPGGFVEANVLGAEAGGNQRIILVQHLLRISLIVLVVPLAFWAVRGHAVGSAAGVAMGGPAGSLGLADAVILAAAGIVGTLVARRIRLPAPDISGAIAASAIVHLAGWTDARLPFLLIVVTQLVVGTSLGVGLAGISRQELLRAIGLGLGALAIVFGLAIVVALLLRMVMDVRLDSLVLAFAPGGVAEMSLVALSLDLSVPFVTVHHLYRIFFTVAVIPRFYRLFARW